LFYADDVNKNIVNKTFTTARIKKIGRLNNFSIFGDDTKYNERDVIYIDIPTKGNYSYSLDDKDDGFNKKKREIIMSEYNDLSKLNNPSELNKYFIVFFDAYINNSNITARRILSDKKYEYDKLLTLDDVANTIIDNTKNDDKLNLTKVGIINGIDICYNSSHTYFMKNLLLNEKDHKDADILMSRIILYKLKLKFNSDSYKYCYLINSDHLNIKLGFELISQHMNKNKNVFGKYRDVYLDMIKCNCMNTLKKYHHNLSVNNPSIHNQSIDEYIRAINNIKLMNKL